jgi:excisionase family DNA binding protein
VPSSPYGQHVPKKRLLSSGELADELGLSRRSISRYAEEGLIRVAMVTPGGRFRFDLDEVREDLRKLAQDRKRDD